MSNPFGSPVPQRGGTGGRPHHVDALAQYHAPSSSSSRLRTDAAFASPTAMANARAREQLSQVRNSAGRYVTITLILLRRLILFCYDPSLLSPLNFLICVSTHAIVH